MYQDCHGSGSPSIGNRFVSGGIIDHTLEFDEEAVGVNSTKDVVATILLLEGKKRL